jgi:transposase
MINVGIDVHVRNCFVHACDDQGRTVARGRCSTDLAGLAQRLTPIESLDQPVRVVIESRSNSRGVARLLERYGREAQVDLTVDVLDARQLRIIAQSVKKNDAVDAKVLCELAGSNLTLPTCDVPDDEVFALREHLRARSDLVRVRTMMKNRVHAVLHRRAIQTPHGDLFGKAGRRWLDELALDEAGRAIVSRYIDQLDALNTTIKQSTDQLRQLMRQDRWAKPAALLQTMPGVGVITSLMVLGELGDITRFRGRAAVANYAGLTPTMRDSADTFHRGHITRQGPTHLRSALVEAAWMAVVRVPRYQQMFDRIAERRGKCIAIVAVARRMLEDMYTMLRKDQAFRYDPLPSVAG